jgi:prepilin-type N-terminal cleavage/methylation domain-containing protein
MNRAFTLIEILVVLAIAALGWLWLPSLLSSSVVQAPNLFKTQFEEISARARMEAIARGQNAALAINARGTQMAVIVMKDNDFEKVASLDIPASVVFDANNSSVNGNPGQLAIVSLSDDYYRVWWYDKNGKPTQTGGLLTFAINGLQNKWSISDEGGLLQN